MVEKGEHNLHYKITEAKERRSNRGKNTSLKSAIYMKYMYTHTYIYILLYCGLLNYENGKSTAVSHILDPIE